MVVKVRMKTIFAGVQGTCLPGQEIEVTKEQARALVPTYADLVEEAQTEASTEELTPPVEAKEKEPNPTSIGYPSEIGGGWYELSNGEKIRGKEAAAKAQADIDESE